MFSELGIIRYEETSKGWDMIGKIIRANKKNNKVW